jgi:hypothetical protein
MRKHFYNSQEHLCNSEYRFNFEKQYFATVDAYTIKVGGRLYLEEEILRS